MTVPPDPRIFHITHIDNLPSIVHEGGLWCDQQRVARRLANTNIGHMHIKTRRTLRAVATQAGGVLADYVPFNFCPRSVMLFAIHKGHQDYAGGQQNVLHLVSTIGRATALKRTWAFTDRHAELAHALYFDDLARLSEVSWHVMDEQYWTLVKEERQAEFLVREFFPWSAIVEVAAMTSAVAQRARAVIGASGPQPSVTVRQEWYY